MGIQTSLHKKHLCVHHTSSFPCSQQKDEHSTQCCTEDTPSDGVGWAGFGYIISLVWVREVSCSRGSVGKMSSVKKPNATMGIIKVLLDNRVKDWIRKWSLDLIELMQF